MWQSREIGRKLFATDGSFPGFSSATTIACHQSFGIFLVSVQLLKKRSSQSRALGPNCLISSVWMSSRPGALPFFSTLMPMASSAAVNALVNPGSSGYCCRSSIEQMCWSAFSCGVLICLVVVRIVSHFSRLSCIRLWRVSS